MKKNIQFIVKRDLLDQDFSEYKLSLDPIPNNRIVLETAPAVAERGEEQFSFAETKVFSLNNYLHVNPDDQNNAFYVSGDGSIMQVPLDNLFSIEDIQKVGEIPHSRDVIRGDYPTTLEFASQSLAVLNDGVGFLHFFSISKTKWNNVHVEELNEEKSILKYVKKDGEYLHVVLQYISSSCSYLLWLTFNKKWEKIRFRNIKLNSDYSYIALEESALGLLLISNSTPTFLDDSDKIVKQTPEEKYFWTQSSNFVTIWVERKNLENDMIHFSLSDSFIKVQINEEDILSGDLTHPISNHKWTVKNGKFELVLTKSEVDLGWVSIIKNDLTGIQVQTFTDAPDGEALYNTDELEECDVSEPMSFLRLDGNSHEVTHEVDLATSQYLFHTPLTTEKPPAICLRNLSDGCIWTVETSSSNNFVTHHVGTFNAFGYVLASKFERKFVVTEPQFSYVAIANAFRHIYIFRQPGPVSGELKNRTTGKRIKAIAKQHIINLETNDEIIGLRATYKFLLILTKCALFALEIHTE